MKRRFQIILIALAALVAVSHREAASQDPTPTVPTKQTPPLIARRSMRTCPAPLFRLVLCQDVPDRRW